MRGAILKGKFMQEPCLSGQLVVPVAPDPPPLVPAMAANAAANTRSLSTCRNPPEKLAVRWTRPGWARRGRSGSENYRAARTPASTPIVGIPRFICRH